VEFEDPRIVTLRVRNTGKKAITEEDFAAGQPIMIVNQGAETADVQITDKSPELRDDTIDIAVDYEQEPDSRDLGKITLLPKLVNPGEWFDVQILYSSFARNLSVTARFADQRRPMRRLDVEYTAASRGYDIFMLIWSSIVVGMGFGVGLKTYVTIGHPTDVLFTVFPILALVLLIMTVPRFIVKSP
jgi:hypothetical protein